MDFLEWLIMPYRVLSKYIRSLNVCVLWSWRPNCNFRLQFIFQELGVITLQTVLRWQTYFNSEALVWVLNKCNMQPAVLHTCTFLIMHHTPQYSFMWCVYINLSTLIYPVSDSFVTSICILQCFTHVQQSVLPSKFNTCFILSLFLCSWVFEYVFPVLVC